MSLTKSYILTLSLMLSVSGTTHALSDADFEKLLVEHNDDFKALHLKKEALSDSAEEANLIFSWQFVGALGWRGDGAPSLDPNFSYDSISTWNGDLGFQKASTWGLETKLGLNSVRTKIEAGNSGQGVFDSTGWQSVPSLEVRLPLVAGGFGRKLRAEYQALSFQKRSEALAAEIEYDQKVQEAKSLFWATVLQREAISTQKASLERIQKIFNIAQAQSRRNLEASSNLLQARSALEQTELELKAGQLKAAQLERLLRVVLSKISNVTLPSYDFGKFSKVSENEYVGKISAQDRLSSFSQQAQASLAGAGYEDTLPRLDLLATYSQDGRKSSLGGSVGESLKPNSQTGFIGLQWRIPLEAKLSQEARARRATLLRVAALREAYAEREEAPAMTEDLVSQFNQSVDLMSLTLKLEKTQTDKVNNERALLGQGRSSMYQVLQFEIELARAKAAKFSLALDIEKLHQQLSLKKYSKYE